jgi:hypothetical protein
VQADAQWKASGTVRYGPERATYAADVASVRAKLNAGEFNAAWTEGQAIRSERAITAALERLQAS